MLANGTVQILDAYEASILWEGQRRVVEVMAVDAHPLAGMKLLEDFEMRIEVRRAGKVSVTRLP